MGTELSWALSAAVLIFFGCDRKASNADTKSASPVATPSGGAPAPSPSPSGASRRSDPASGCSTLRRNTCLGRADCTLVKGPGKSGGPNSYICRPSAGRCETGLKQSSTHFATQCRSRGCTYTDAACYCACRGYGRTTVEDGSESERCLCECAYGEPARCTDPKAAATACAKLPRATCLESAACTLGQPGKRGTYECRPATGACETGLTQANPKFEQRCAARSACKFQDAQCYCHCRGSGSAAVPDGKEAEDCDCDCSGGPPPRCVARSMN